LTALSCKYMMLGYIYRRRPYCAQRRARLGGAVGRGKLC